MASGKSLIKSEPRKFRVYYNPDGSPIKRRVPKVHMSKKERRKMRAAKRPTIAEAAERIMEEAL
jgi:hypothetical protein